VLIDTALVRTKLSGLLFKQLETFSKLPQFFENLAPFLKAEAG